MHTNLRNRIEADIVLSVQNGYIVVHSYRAGNVARSVAMVHSHELQPNLLLERTSRG